MRLPVLRSVVTFLLLTGIAGTAGTAVKENGKSVFVKSEKTYKPHDKIVLTAGNLPEGNPRIVWRVEGDAQYEKSESGKNLYVWARPGTYRVRLMVIEFKKEFFEETETSIKVEGAPDPGPGPGPGPGPDPGPGPTPAVKIPPVAGKRVEEAKGAMTALGLIPQVYGSGPVVVATIPMEGTAVLRGSTVTLATGEEPGPGPGPKPDAPIKAPGYRVLIVEESAERSKLPKEQYNVLFNKDVRSFLNSNTAKDAENPQGAWRIWDKDVDASAESKAWQDAMKRPMKSYPWIIISDGNTGYEGPLPKNVQETLELLKKYLPKSRKGGR